MSKKFQYKYICQDCDEATRFSAKERIAAGGMQCRFCGSRHLEPSKSSHARQNIGAFHDMKNENEARLNKKRGL